MAEWFDDLWSKAGDLWDQAGREIDQTREEQEAIAKSRRLSRRRGDSQDISDWVIGSLDGLRGAAEPAAGGGGGAGLGSTDQQMIQLLTEIRDTLKESQETLKAIQEKNNSVGVYGP